MTRPFTDIDQELNELEELSTLPAGSTCADCRHYKRCAWLVRATPSWTACDWFPSRFEPVPPA